MWIAALLAVAQVVCAQNLAAVSFDDMIASPLRQILKSQADLAAESARMFTDVGFHDNGTAIMVTFGFSKDTDGSFNLTVPFITMVHIPALEVSEAVFQFDAKISSTLASVSSGDTPPASSLGLKAGYSQWDTAVRMSTAFSNKKTAAYSGSFAGVEANRDFAITNSLSVKQSDLTDGMLTLLDIMRNSVVRTTVPEPAPEPETP